MELTKQQKSDLYMSHYYLSRALFPDNTDYVEQTLKIIAEEKGNGLYFDTNN